MNAANLREYAQTTVARALELQQQELDEPADDDPDEEDDTCALYQDECNNYNRVTAIRRLLEQPHGDDSPCTDTVWTAVDAVLNQALDGIEAALGLG